MPYAHSNHILQPYNVIQNVSLGLRHATLSLKLCTFAVTEFLTTLLLLAQIRALQEAPSTGTQVWGTYSNVETLYPGRGIPANGFGASCDPGARFPHPRLCPEFGITQCQVFGVFLKSF